MPSESRLMESWSRTLAGIPTLLGRLAWLASLRNANSGIYEHFGMAQRSSEADVDRIIRRSHGEIFQEWLCLTLPRQKEDVANYMEGLGGDQRETLASWLALSPCGAWLPAESRDAERELFLDDLGEVLEALRTDYGVAARRPE